MQEMFHGTPSKESKFALDEDVISSMPDNVITNILDRLPIQYAVRTDVLSQSWRFKWTLLTQLVFDENFFEYLRQLYDYHRNSYKYDYGRGISRLLLHLKGPITKFVLYIPYNDQLLHGNDICHWVLFLSRKGIKDFTLLYKSTTRVFKSPTQLFSCTELKHLKLESFCFRLPPSFGGFPNLLSLDLYIVTFESCTCGEFLARCPLLETLKISLCGDIRELELNEIAKLVKLKMLHLNLVMLDVVTLITLQKSLAEDGVEKFPTALCLETLTLSNVDLGNNIMELFVFDMIRGSPNLQTLEITATYQDKVPPTDFFPYIYSMGQLQLQSVVFGGFIGSENEVYLIES